MQRSASSPNSPRVPGSLLGLLAFGQCMALIDRNLPAVAAPLMKADLALSDAQFGLLQGFSFALLYATGMLLSWPLAYSMRRLQLLAACAATWTSGMLVFAFGHTFGALLVGRALVGLGESMFEPLALGLVVAHVAPAWRARSMALLTAASVAGRSLSLLLGGAVLAGLARWLPTQPPMHWRLLFVVMALPNLLTIVWLLRSAELALNPFPPRPRKVFVAVLNAFGERPRVLGAYLCSAAAALLVARALGAWAPSVLHREQGFAPATAALVFGAAMLIASPLGDFIAGILVDKFRSPMAILTAALLLAAPALGAMPWAGSPMVACVLLTLAAVLTGAAAVAVLYGWPSMLDPSLRDAGLRVFLVFIVLISEGLGPWLAGTVSDGMGTGAHALSLALSRVCMLAAAMGVAAALLARAGRPRPAVEEAAG
ncbi:MFS transporter [Dyella flagellata]|uniref:Major facilitator superfamily (MFS) profile domain-containing protein n=1 Tax=Dyella flagellata TaxID=1867833 RepID=A0ABQ5XJ97_9GAMM|nr:MFS transporter [Dyella flagellata]GLQ90696.1 hypothetical protein GCM10007898_42720 [Dyella flagellata]